MRSGDQDAMRAARYALLAGSIAIAVNMLLLRWSAKAGLQTGQGSLSQLLVWLHTGRLMWQLPSIGGIPATVWRPVFHVVVGLLLAVIYALFLEPRLRKVFTPLVSGLFYALGIWLLNAWIVLPLLGMGIAGESIVPAIGMLYFAFAHTAFFVILSILYAKFLQRSS